MKTNWIQYLICWGQIELHGCCFDLRENFDEYEHFAIFRLAFARHESLQIDVNEQLLVYFCDRKKGETNDDNKVLYQGIIAYIVNLLINILCKSNVGDASCIFTKYVHMRIENCGVDCPIILS
jgi:hypothetical protein